jgi:hypothetical protein
MKLSRSCGVASPIAWWLSAWACHAAPSAGGDARTGELAARSSAARTTAPRCEGRDFDHKAYSYLLGLYLGDGHIISKVKQHTLSIYLDDGYPGLIDAAEAAMRNVMPGPCVGRRQKTGCTKVKSYTMHWTCMFPQHGPGKKHDRRITLEPWQREIVDE